MGIKVQATQVGYMNYPYNRRIKEGEIFEIQNMKQFSEKWMRKVDGDGNPIKKSPTSGPREAKPLSAGSRAINEGKVVNPAKRHGEGPQPKFEDGPGEQTAAPEEQAASAQEAPAQEATPGAETTGNEEVI